jgi:hypothetical protein
LSAAPSSFSEEEGEEEEDASGGGGGGGVGVEVELSGCEYHRVRLHEGLVEHAFDSSGTCVVPHLECLQEELCVRGWTMASAKRDAVARQVRSHGLKGKGSNNAKRKLQDVFVAWVKMNRTPAVAVGAVAGGGGGSSGGFLQDDTKAE